MNKLKSFGLASIVIIGLNLLLGPIPGSIVLHFVWVAVALPVMFFRWKYLLGLSLLYVGGVLLCYTLEELAAILLIGTLTICVVPGLAIGGLYIPIFFAADKL